MCHMWEVNCKVSETVSNIADNIITGWAEAVMDGVNRTLATLGSIWVNVPANVGDDQSVIQFLQSRTSWLVLLLASGSIVVAAIQLAWAQRAEPTREVLAGMLRLVIIAAAFPAITQLLINIGDDYSTWVIEQAADTMDGKFMTKIMDTSLYTPGGLGVIIIILGGLMAHLRLRRQKDHSLWFTHPSLGYTTVTSGIPDSDSSKSAAIR